MTAKLLDSLLDAIVRLDADALVMHVGDKPYVVTTSAAPAEYRGPLAWGQVELSSRVLTSDAVLGLLGQLLPDDQQQALEEFGAIEHALPPVAGAADRFTIVAARSGDDVWLEVRRKPLIPARPMLAAAPEEAQAEVEPEHVEAPPARAALPVLVIEEEGAEEEEQEEEEVVFELSLDPIAPPPPVAPPEPLPASLEIVQEENQSTPTDDEVDALLAATAATLLAKAAAPDPPVEPRTPSVQTADLIQGPAAADQTEEIPTILLDVDTAILTQVDPAPPLIPVADVMVVAHEPAAPEMVVADGPAAPQPAALEPPLAPAVPEVPAPLTVPTLDADGEAPERVVDEPRQAVVLPISRLPLRPEPPPEATAMVGAPLERVLRIAAARGASTVYVVAQSRPVIRVDGEIGVLDGEAVMSAAEVERLVTDLMPARGRDQSRGGGEWMADVPDVGRVRCVTFRDHRGPGVIFRMIPPQAISVEQLGLSPEIQALCSQPDGLVLVTGARASGKSTLVSAFVDLINRTRSDHVITIESQIGFVHESRKSFVSQREVRGDGESAAAAVRSALREDPDVIVIEDLRAPEIAAMALEAAESGRLVFASVAATSTVAAIERFIEMFPPERRGEAQTALAGALRGVVSQVLLRKVRGGRTAAREVLLNTPPVASLILEGKTFQLPVALDSGRRHGMMPLADALAALVRDGTVHEAEAYRKAFDREALLAVLKRQGVDTTFAERLA
jgi:twitching motility protein PilT